MAALPSRYGQGASSDSGVVTNNFVVSIGIIVGGCGLAVMSSCATVKKGEFYNFGSYVLDILGQTPFVTYVGYGALVLGVLSIVCGFVVSMSGLLVSKNPKCIYVGMLCLVACAAANLAAGAMIQNGVTLLNKAIYEQTTPAPIGSFTQNVTHLQLAMFNGCCAAKGTTHTKEVFPGDVRQETKDLDGYVKFCDTLHEDNLADMDKNRVRTCYKDPETYYYYNYSVGINLPRVCAALELSQVNIAGKKIPGSSLDVTALTQGKTVIPIAGQTAAPVFGCGTGYAKAFQAAMLIWAENIIQPVATTLIACGSVYVVLLLLTFATFYACSKTNAETAEERYARYLEEIHTSKDNQVADSFEQQNPNRMSVNVNRMSVNQPMAPMQYSQRMSLQSHHTTGSHGSSSQYGQPVTQYQQQEMGFNVDDKI